MSVATSAFGAAGTISTVSVTPVTSQVTYSSNSPLLETFVGYFVNFANAGKNTINNVEFRFAATTTDPAEAATLSLFQPLEYLPAGCKPTGPASFTCTKSQLKSGESFSSAPFIVFFKAPLKVGSETTDKIEIAGRLIYAEGTSGANPAPNSNVEWLGPPVLLGTTNPINIKSALTRSGGSFSTGNGGVPTPVSDTGFPFAASVTVPPPSSFAPTLDTPPTLDISLGEASGAGCVGSGQISQCYRSAITIPSISFDYSSGKYITIVLRLDESLLIGKPFKIAAINVWYTGDDLNLYEIKECPGYAANIPTPRTDGIPCIAKRVQYKNKSATPGLSGDVEITFFNLKNGAFTLF